MGNIQKKLGWTLDRTCFMSQNNCKIQKVETANWVIKKKYTS